MSTQYRPTFILRLTGLGIALLVGIVTVAQAQRGLRPVRRPTSTPAVALSAMVTYQWGGSLNTPRGRLRLDPSENYAGVLAFRVRSGATAELYYSYQPTLMTIEGGGGIREEVAPMGVHYFQIGGRYEPARSDRFVPFLAASVGATLFDARRNAAGVDLGSDWAAAFRLVGGATAWLNQRIGVRAEGGLLLPWWWTSGGFLCGPTGCYTTMGGTAIAQGTVGGGVTIAF